MIQQRDSFYLKIAIKLVSMKNLVSKVKNLKSLMLMTKSSKLLLKEIRVEIGKYLELTVFNAEV